MEADAERRRFLLGAIKAQRAGDRVGDAGRVVKGLGVGPEFERRFRMASDRIVERALAVADVDALFLPALEALPLIGISLLGGSPSTLDRARAAVTIEPGQVLHERILIGGVSGPAGGGRDVDPRSRTASRRRRSGPCRSNSSTSRGSSGRRSSAAS